MEDIKVGQFVRDNEFGRIGKIIAIENDMFMFECSNGTGIGYFSLNNCEFSPNIIDLIEVGDYVNGYKIIEDEGKLPNGENAYVVFKRDGHNYLKIWCEEDIKSIVTKEQFSFIEYKVGEE